MTDTPTALRFKGGPQNGKVCPKSEARADGEVIELPYETYLAMREGGDVRICKGELQDDWFSTTASIYLRRADQPDAGVVHYDFHRNREIGRCAALKSGGQCANAAIEGELLCLQHDRQSASPRQIKDTHLMAELRDIAKSGRLQQRLIRDQKTQYD